MYAIYIGTSYINELHADFPKWNGYLLSEYHLLGSV